MEFGRTLTITTSNADFKVYSGHSYKEPKQKVRNKLIRKLLPTSSGRLSNPKLGENGSSSRSSFKKDDASVSSSSSVKSVTRKLSRNLSHSKLVGRVKSMQSFKKPEMRRVKSLMNTKEMKAGLDDSVDNFERNEEMQIVSVEELHDIILALAQAKSRDSETFTISNRDNIEEEIEKVMEFWRLINAQKPKVAYELIWDDIQSVQEHWDDIQPNLSKEKLYVNTLEQLQKTMEQTVATTSNIVGQTVATTSNMISTTSNMISTTSNMIKRTLTA